MTRLSVRRFFSTLFYLKRESLIAIASGALLPLGFAPFHLPGLALLGIAVLFVLLQSTKPWRSFSLGFQFGLGYFSLGVSWVYVSIHNYGHIHPLGSAAITLLFVLFLSLYPAIIGLLYGLLNTENSSQIRHSFLFAAIWCVGELLRATLFGGFPWLLLGFSQMDTPLRYLLPVVGVYGASFLACFAACLLGSAYLTQSMQRAWYVVAFILILLMPLSLKPIVWTQSEKAPTSVSIIQANLSMRDKWDESLFWQLLDRYQKDIDHLIGKTQVIVLPESAIPVPPSYIADFLDNTATRAKENNTAVILGLPHPANMEESEFYNAMLALGTGYGVYNKRHIVPFGEYIPHVFSKLLDWLQIPIINLHRGKANQPLITIAGSPIASLICYELAYPALLRQQLPAAEWIVSISDDGWFGHSFAMYQQVQMAQVLSTLSARFQVIANNDGLSSLIAPNGDVIDSLPPFTSAILDGEIISVQGMTPWIKLGDIPVLLLCFLIVSYSPIAARRERRYSYQPS